MKNKFLGSLRVFKNEEETSQGDRVFEITDIFKNGVIELAFDGAKGDRYYATFKLQDLVSATMDLAR